MHSKNEKGTPYSILLLISLFFINTFIITGYYSKYLLVTSDSVLQLISYSIVLNLLVLSSLLSKWENLSFYILVTISFYLAGLIVISRSLLSFLLLIPALAGMVIYASQLGNNDKLSKGVSLYAVIFLVLIISKVFVFVNQQTASSIIIQNLSDRISTIGFSLPITEIYGIFVSTPYADVIISPLQFFLTMSLSSLLVENYHRIFSLIAKRRNEDSAVNGKGSGVMAAGYGIVAALSCQCESSIALLPAVTILLLNIMLIPFIFLSVFLLIMTYFFVSRYYERKRTPRFLATLGPAKIGMTLVMALTITFSQLLVLLGILYDLETSPFFLFGTGMFMILDGFILFYLISSTLKRRFMKPYFGIFLLFISSFLAIIWFDPPITRLAIENAVVFSIMSYTMTLSGFLIGASFFMSGKRVGLGIIEVYAVLLGIVPIFIYYYTFSLQSKIWPFWSLGQQTELAVFLWIIMLPVMWLSTQKSLSPYPSIPSSITLQM